MKIMKKKFYASMHEQTLMILNRRQGGVSPRELMAQLYTENLENKSEKQGLLMADEALDAVREFHQQYTDVTQDPIGISERLFGPLLEEKELSERCEILAQLCAGIAATEAKRNGASEEEIESLLCQVKDGLSAEATPELEAMLQTRAVELLCGNTFLSCGLIRQAEELEAIVAENGLEYLALQIGDDEAVYEGVLTMLTYIAAKKGEGKLPPDMTIRETAYVVGSTMERMYIAHRVSMGELTLNVAIDLLSILGAVLILRLAIHLLALGASLLTGLVGFILIAPAAAILSMGMLALLNLVIRHRKGIWNAMTGASKLIVKTSVKAVILGLRKLAGFFANTVVSNVSAFLDRTFAVLLGTESPEVSSKNTVRANAQ